MTQQRVADEVAGFQVVGDRRSFGSRRDQRLDRRDVVAGVAVPAIFGAAERTAQSGDVVIVVPVLEAAGIPLLIERVENDFA